MANTLKQDLEKKKVVFGEKVVLKMLRKGELVKVYVASGCRVRDEVVRYAGLGGAEVVEMKEDNKALGLLCKKPFSISVLGFEK